MTTVPQLLALAKEKQYLCPVAFCGEQAYAELSTTPVNPEELQLFRDPDLKPEQVILAPLPSVKIEAEFVYRTTVAKKETYSLKEGAEKTEVGG